MAFQFVPNADGSFTEGDKQTNPETNQEYIFTDGAWRALGIEVATDLTELDKRYLQLSGGTLTNRLFFDWGSEGHNLLISPNSDNTASSIYSMNSGSLRFRSIPAEDINDNSSTHVSFGKADDGTPETNIYHLQDPQDELWGVNKRYVDNNYFKLTGGTISGIVNFQRGSKDTPQLKISPNSGTDFATNIYSLNNGQMRLRTSHTANDNNHVGSHIVLDPNNGVPITKIYHVATPTTELMAANKKYVDSVGTGKAFPPGLHFRYTASEGVNQDNGLFSYYDDNGIIKMRLNNTSRDLEWNKGGPIGTVNYDPFDLNNGIRFSIYMLESSGNWRIVRDGTVKNSDWKSGYVEFEINSQRTNGAFSTTQEYYITVSGLF